MKNRYLSILFFLCLLQSLHSQEGGVASYNIPVRNSLKFNKFIINPAFSFAREQNSYVTVFNKREWVQFDDAPQTYLVSYSGRFRESQGISLGLFQQNYGVLTTFGGIANFAQNVYLSQDSNLTFGVNLGFYKSGINIGKVVTNSADPSLELIPSNSLVTLSPGINYGNTFFDFGLAFKNAVLYNLQTSQMVQNDPERSIQAHIMYTGFVDTNGFFDKSKFSGLVRAESKKDKTVISGLMMFAIPRGVWAQAGYNSFNGVSAGVGLNLTSRLAIEYNYEKALGKFTQFGPSHEIVLAYKFKGKYSDDDEEEGAIISPSETRRVAPVKTLDKATVKIDDDIQKANELKRANAKLLLQENRLKSEKLLADAAAKTKATAEANEKIKLDNAATAKAKLDENRMRREKALADAAAKAKAAADAKSKSIKEIPNQSKDATAAKNKADADAKAKLVLENKLKADALAKSVTDAQNKAIADAKKLAADAKAKADAQAKLALENKLKADAKAKLEADARSKAIADAEKLAADEKARSIAAASKQAADEKAKADAKAKLEADAKSKAIADAEKLAADEKARSIAAASKLAADEKARADAKAKLEADAKSKATADAEKLAADEKARADAKAKLEADAKSKAIADAEKLAADEKAKADAQAKSDADAKTRAALEEVRVAADAKTKAEAQAKLEADAKAKSIAESARLIADAKAKAEAQAKLEADAKAREAAESARLIAAAKAKAEAQEQLIAAAKAKSIADAAKSASDAKAKADAQAKADADAKAKSIADAAKIAADAKAKADAQAKLDADAKAKSIADLKAKADAQAKLEAEARAKAEAEATRIATDLQSKADAQAKLDAEARAKAEAETKRLAADSQPKDANAKSMDNIAETIDNSNKTQIQLLAQLNEKVKQKENELQQLKTENDLSDQGITSAPKEFKSVSAENAALESLKLEIASVNTKQNQLLNNFKNLYDERIKKVSNKNDALTLSYLKTIDLLKAEQAKAELSNSNLIKSLEKISVETEIEKKRRIKRANFVNEDSKYATDQETLKRIKATTAVSSVKPNPNDFDYGSEQSNLQIIKNVKNVETGYYVVLAVHADVQKRDTFVTKTVAAGESNIDFFYDVKSTNYFIYTNRFDNIQEATRVLESKGNKPYNGKMVIVRVEN